MTQASGKPMGERMLIGYVVLMVLAVLVVVFQRHLPRFVALGLTAMAWLVASIIALAYFSGPALPVEQVAGYHVVTSEVVAYVGDEDQTKVVTIAGNKVSSVDRTNSLPLLGESLTYYCNDTNCYGAGTKLDQTVWWEPALAVLVAIASFAPTFWILWKRFNSA